MARWLLLMAVAAGLALALCSSQFTRAGDKGKQDDKDGWVQLFNGKDLTGWKTHEKHPGKWTVKNGILFSGGRDTSHLFSERGDYTDFHYRIEAKINDVGNSGQYFRTQFGPGYPKGYEAQINSTFPDPQKTGSLYSFVPIKESLHKPDEWFTQEVIAKGNHIQIILNGKKVVDFKDEKSTHTKGHFALQQHGPARLKKDGKDVEGPEVILQVRKIEVKELK